MATTELILTGEASSLERELEAINKELRKTSDAVDKAGDEMSRSARRFDDFAESADTFETRAQGARDGLTGLEDSAAAAGAIMRGDLFEGALLAGSGMADLGSTAANFVGPKLKDLVTRLGATRLALLGVAGVAGIAAAAILYFATQGERAKVSLEDIQEDLDAFLKTGGRRFTGELRRIFGESTEAIDNFRAHVSALQRDDALGDLARAGFGQFDDALRSMDEGLANAIETSDDYVRATEALRTAMGDEAFQEATRLGLLDQFLAKGLDVVAMEGFIADEAKNVAEGFKLSSTNLQEFMDLLRAQTNPVFAFAKAQEGVAAAQEAYNEALEKHGPNSEEARRASLDLLAAQLELEETAAKANQTTDETVRQLQEMADKGYASAAGVAELERQLANAQERAKQMEQLRIQLVIEEVQASGRSIDELNWRFIGQVAGPGPQKFHDGGVVPGPRGQDVLAILQAGERVVPLDQAGTGGTTVLEVRADDSETAEFIAGMLRRHVRANGGNVQTAIGF